MPPFKLDAVYSPTADQPNAIATLARGIERGDTGPDAARRDRHRQDDDDGGDDRGRPAPGADHGPQQDARGAALQRVPDVLPDNSVEYFVSYYDYYQPEAYVPSRDLYIEKDSAINQEIDRLRHAATASLFARRDVIIVASVSCIFGLGSPETYNANCQVIVKGHDVDRDELLRKLVACSTTATTRRSAAARSACAARRWRSSRPTRRRRSGCCCSATRSSACSTSTR